MSVRYLVIPIVLALSQHVSAQVFDYNWAMHFRASLTGGYNSIGALATDTNGNIYVTGQVFDSLYIEDTFIVSKVESDAYLAKFDSAGTLLWIRQGGGYNLRGVAVSTDENGNAYCLFAAWDSIVFNGDTIKGGTNLLLLAKYDRNGNLIWHRYSAGHSTFPQAMCRDNEGNVIITGQTTLYTIFEDDTFHAENTYGVFIAKYTSGGELVWAYVSKDELTYNGTWVTDVKSDAIGNIYITGDHYEHEIFFSKYSSGGKFQWIRKEPGDGSDQTATCIEIDKNNNIYIGGSLRCSISSCSLGSTYPIPIGQHAFFAKYNQNALKDAEIFTGKGFDDVNAIAIQNNDLYLAADFTNDAVIGDSVFARIDGTYVRNSFVFAKFDLDHNFKWAARMPVSDQSSGVIHEIAVHKDRLYLAGNLNKAKLVAGKDTLDSKGYDLFLVSITDNTYKESGLKKPVNFSKLDIYPNPSRNNITITIPENLKSASSITIKDVQGRELINQKINPGQRSRTFSVAFLPEGLYFISVPSENGVYTTKFIKL